MREKLKEFLMNKLPLARLAKGGSQIICKCAVCETEDTKGHCYIGPFDDDSTPIMYNCFRCNPNNPGKSGVLNQEFMNRYNLWLPDDYQLGKTSSNYIKKKIVGNRRVLDLGIPMTNSKEYQMKLMYINKRLGLNLTYDDLIKLKICLNLKDLLLTNEVHSFTRYESIIDQLGRNFIGALGVNNNIISLRRLSENGLHDSVNKRYVNYVVSDNIDTEKFYMIPNTVNNIAPVNIHIAEGYFDILGIFFNLYNGDCNQNLFIAGFGKSYEESLKFILCNFPMLYTCIHLYPDLDVNDWSIRNLCNKIAPTVNEIYVHRNIKITDGKQEKDYGVSRDRIQDSIQKIK